MDKFWILFKGYLNLFKDCQSFLNTKQPVWIIIYLETQLLLCWTGCICFRFSHHVISYIHIHIHIHTSHSFNHLLILIHGHLPSHHTPHSVISYSPTWSSQFWFVSLVWILLFKYCSISIVIVAYCSKSVSQQLVT